MRKLLVVVDCQKDFIDGALGFEGADKIIPGIIARIGEYKASGDEVVYTLDTHTEDYMNTQEGRNLPVPHCIKGTPGWQLNESVAAALDKKGYTPVEKVTFGAAQLPGLVMQACAGEPCDIELIGLCTDICVVSNALLLKTIFCETPISVDSACCAGVTPEKHQAALETMRSCHIEIR